METPFNELIETLKRSGGFCTKDFEWSVKHWIHHPEAINVVRRNRWERTEAAEQALQLVEAYNQPHENETIQRLSEIYRKRFII